MTKEDKPKDPYFIMPWYHLLWLFIVIIAIGGFGFLIWRWGSCSNNLENGKLGDQTIIKDDNLKLLNIKNGVALFTNNRNEIKVKRPDEIGLRDLSAEYNNCKFPSLSIKSKYLGFYATDDIGNVFFATISFSNNKENKYLKFLKYSDTTEHEYLLHDTYPFKWNPVIENRFLCFKKKEEKDSINRIIVIELTDSVPHVIWDDAIKADTILSADWLNKDEIIIYKFNILNKRKMLEQRKVKES